MKRRALLAVALLLLIAALPLISFGATLGRPALWWLGLIILAAGGLIPIATRWIGHGREEEEK